MNSQTKNILICLINNELNYIVAQTFKNYLKIQ